MIFASIGGGRPTIHHFWFGLFGKERQQSLKLFSGKRRTTYLFLFSHFRFYKGGKAEAGRRVVFSVVVRQEFNGVLGLPPRINSITAYGWGRRMDGGGRVGNTGPLGWGGRLLYFWTMNRERLARHKRHPSLHMGGIGKRSCLPDYHCRTTVWDSSPVKKDRRAGIRTCGSVTNAPLSVDEGKRESRRIVIDHRLGWICQNTRDTDLPEV